MRKIVLIVLTCVCLLLSPLASALPDGLETVLEREHLAGNIKELDWPMMADYSVGFVAHPVVQSWVAGISGVLVVAAICLGLSALVRKKHVFGK